MKKGKILIVVCVLAFVSLFAGSKLLNRKSTDIAIQEADNNQIETVSVEHDLMEETITDNTLVVNATVDSGPLFRSEISEIAIIRVLSIDGCDNYWDYTDRYGGAYTYGQFEVVKAIEGTLVEGQVEEYVCPGGTIPWEDYAKGQDRSTVEKQMRLAEEHGDGVPEYVTQVICETALEVGGVYYVAMHDGLVHGSNYLIYPLEYTFIRIDESTLDSEEILGYWPSWDAWFDVTKIWYPESYDDPRLQETVVDEELMAFLEEVEKEAEGH